MKRLTTLFVLLVAVVVVFANPIYEGKEDSKHGIKFAEGSWAEIMELAQKNNKPIFVDCYTTWCGPCKKLSNEVFPQKAVGDYFNANFISVKVDCEKGEGIKLKERFEVGAFPTLLFIDPSGEEVLHRVVGYVPAEKLIEEAKSAPAEAIRVAGLEKAYLKNKNDIKATEEFLSYLIESYDPRAEEVGKHYIGLIPETEWHKKEYFWIFAKYIKDPFSKEAEYFFQHKEKFVEANGFRAEYFPSGMYYSYAGKLSEVENKADFDQESFDKLIQLMEKHGDPGIEGIKDYTNRSMLLHVKDFNTYVDVVERSFEGGLAENPKFYAERGFNLLNPLQKLCSDPAIFKRVVTIMDKVVENQKNSEELDLFSLRIAYRDSYTYLKLAGMEGEKLTVAKEIADLLENMSPKHRKLLDKTYEDAQKAKAEGQTGGRTIPAMKMGGY